MFRFAQHDNCRTKRRYGVSRASATRDQPVVGGFLFYRNATYQIGDEDIWRHVPYSGHR